MDSDLFWQVENCSNYSFCSVNITAMPHLLCGASLLTACLFSLLHTALLMPHPHIEAGGFRWIMAQGGVHTKSLMSVLGSRQLFIFKESWRQRASSTSGAAPASVAMRAFRTSQSLKLRESQLNAKWALLPLKQQAIGEQDSHSGRNWESLNKHICSAALKVSSIWPPSASAC